MTEPSQTWKDWLAAHSGKFLLFARGWGSNKEDSEDLVQEAILRVWNYQQEHRGGALPDIPFVYSTIRFCGLNHHRSETRRKKKEGSILYLYDHEDVWLDPVMEDDEDAVFLRETVQSLSSKLREVVVMKFWAGLTFQEISQALGISPNTAASRYRYAMEQLANELHKRKEVGRAISS